MLRERLEEVAAEDLAATRQIDPRAFGRHRVDVGGDNLRLRMSRRVQRGQCPRAAAQIHDHAVGRRSVRRDVDQQQRPLARNEHTRQYCHHQSTELGRSDDVLQRLTAHPASHQLFERAGVEGRAHQDPGFIFREDATRRPQPRRHLGQQCVGILHPCDGSGVGMALPPQNPPTLALQTELLPTSRANPTPISARSERSDPYRKTGTCSNIGLK